MARLIVEAVSTTKAAAYPITLSILVSVSKAEDGVPVTRLTKENFKITDLMSEKTDGVFTDCDFTCLERADRRQECSLSGMYDIVISKQRSGIFDAPGFTSGELFSFGLRVAKVSSNVHDQGQTVVSLESPG